MFVMTEDEALELLLAETDHPQSCPVYRAPLCIGVRNL